jgi:prepilin-type N-terminal cleavage/methylation domain-containing protein
MQIPKTNSTEQGLTLIESLAAIVIFGVAVVGVTPPIMLSMASRVRSYRAEQAMQLAQGEIDRVRRILERGETAYASGTVNTPQKIVEAFEDQLPPDAGAGQPKDVDAPTGIGQNCKTVLPKDAPLCQVDVNGDGEWDYGVQTFRTKTETLGKSVPVGFYMGVRFYTRGSLVAGGVVKEPARLGFSADNGSGKAPLVVIYNPIVRSDLDTSGIVYCKLVGGCKKEDSEP